MAGERTLVVDIGNSATKWAVYGEPVLDAGTLPIPVARGRDTTLRPESIPGAGVHRVVLVSVVPSRTASAEDALAGAFGCPVLTVHAGLRLPFGMDYGTPDTLGADRIAAAAGAVGPAPSADDLPAIVVDAGSALTVDLVDREARYRGGAIAPGPTLLAAALRAGTAQLPEVEPWMPGSVVGRSTVDALRAGIMVGFVSAFEGIVSRMRGEAGPGCRIVATGGWSSVLARETGLIDLVVPDLVLRGGAVLAGLNS